MSCISAKGANKKTVKSMKEIEDAVRELGGVWPSDDVDAVYLYKIHNRHIALGHPGCTALYICTRAEFEECTRRLRNEPSWNDAPDWAVAKAQDGDGMWCWYEDVPRPGESTFMWSRGAVRFAVKGEVIGDWRDTLRLRPEEKKVESKDDWYKRGEFPPVGTVCEVFPYWHVCESIAPHQNGMVMHDRNNYEYFLANKNTRFRPLQTERDRWIEAAQKVIGCDPNAHRHMLGQLYDAGLAKMPEVK